MIAGIYASQLSNGITMESPLRYCMLKKFFVIGMILLTILGALALTSCTVKQQEHGQTYYPEGIWDEFE